MPPVSNIGIYEGAQNPFREKDPGRRVVDCMMWLDNSLSEAEV